MAKQFIEGIRYEYFIVCKVNKEYKFFSVANKENKKYELGEHFFGNNYKEALSFDSLETINNFRKNNCFNIYHTRAILTKEGFSVGEIEIVSVPRKEMFELENYI